MIQPRKYNAAMENIGFWANNNQGIVAVAIFIATLVISCIVGLFKLLVGKFKPKKGVTNITGDVLQGSHNTKNTTNNTVVKFSTNFSLPDIDFRMTSNYRVNNPKGAVFGTLTTSSSSPVAKFAFLDTREQTIGRVTTFQKIVRSDTDLVANYFIENADNEELLLQSIYKRKGYLHGLVTLTNGDSYIYKYESQGEGWKVSVEENHPNLMDTYILMGKEQYTKLSKEAYEILLELDDVRQSILYVLSTDNTGEFIRVGKRDYTENATNYCEALNELLNAGLIKHTSGHLYKLTSAGQKKAKLLLS